MNCKKKTEETEEMERPNVDVGGSLRQQEAEKCDECPICYQEFTYKTELPDCGHKFCFLCIKGLFFFSFFVLSFGKIHGEICRIFHEVIYASQFGKKKDFQIYSVW